MTERRGVGESLDDASITLAGGLGATPWVDRLLTKHWGAIEKVAPDGAMPELEKRGKRGKVTAREYGCGHYGCVMPTTDPNLVCKVTSDETEAFFVAAALELDELPAGLVQYVKIYAFPGGTHRNRPAFILWREAAHDVGKSGDKFWGIASPYGRDYDSQNVDEILRLLSTFKSIGGGVREAFKRTRDPEQLAADAAALEDWAWDWGAEHWDALYNHKGPSLFNPFGDVTRGMNAARKFAAGLRLAHICIEHMENTYRCDSIGSAFGFYLEQGILLCDVHGQNVGRVDRSPGSDGGTEPLVITDPGHALALDARWAHVQVPELP